MNGNKIFYISWKGEQSGAYTKEDILEMLNVGKIGYLHKVRTQNSDWVLLKDANLDELALKQPVKTEYKTDYFAILMYTVAGLSFLSVWILGASFGLSVYAYTMKDKKNAIASMLLAFVISACGFLFFETIFPAISE